jgi:hypothetical protein
VKQTDFILKLIEAKKMGKVVLLIMENEMNMMFDSNIVFKNKKQTNFCFFKRKPKKVLPFLDIGPSSTTSTLPNPINGKVSEVSEMSEATSSTTIFGSSHEYTKIITSPNNNKLGDDVTSTTMNSDNGQGLTSTDSPSPANGKLGEPSNNDATSTTVGLTSTSSTGPVNGKLGESATNDTTSTTVGMDNSQGQSITTTPASKNEKKLELSNSSVSNNTINTEDHETSTLISPGLNAKHEVHSSNEASSMRSTYNGANGGNNDISQTTTVIENSKGNNLKNTKEENDNTNSNSNNSDSSVIFNNGSLSTFNNSMPSSEITSQFSTQGDSNTMNNQQSMKSTGQQCAVSCNGEKCTKQCQICENGKCRKTIETLSVTEAQNLMSNSQQTGAKSKSCSTKCTNGKCTKTCKICENDKCKTVIDEDNKTQSSNQQADENSFSSQNNEILGKNQNNGDTLSSQFSSQYDVNSRNGKHNSQSKGRQCSVSCKGNQCKKECKICRDGQCSKTSENMSLTQAQEIMSKYKKTAAQTRSCNVKCKNGKCTKECKICQNGKCRISGENTSETNEIINSKGTTNNDGQPSQDSSFMTDDSFNSKNMINGPSNGVQSQQCKTTCVNNKNCVRECKKCVDGKCSVTKENVKESEMRDMNIKNGKSCSQTCKNGVCKTKCQECVNGNCRTTDDADSSSQFNGFTSGKPGSFPAMTGTSIGMHDNFGSSKMDPGYVPDMGGQGQNNDKAGSSQSCQKKCKNGICKVQCKVCKNGKCINTDKPEKDTPGSDSQNGRSCSTSCKGSKCETICKICENGKCRTSKKSGKDESPSMQGHENTASHSNPSGQNGAF